MWKYFLINNTNIVHLYIRIASATEWNTTCKIFCVQDIISCFQNSTKSTRSHIWKILYTVIEYPIIFSFHRSLTLSILKHWFNLGNIFFKYLAIQVICIIAVFVLWINSNVSDSCSLHRIERMFMIKEKILHLKLILYMWISSIVW